MKENFSKRVQYIIKQSKEEAIRLGHSYVGSEHLLIGLLKSETGMAKKIIDVFDIDSNDMISVEAIFLVLNNSLLSTTLLMTLSLNLKIDFGSFIVELSKSKSSPLTS